MALALAGTLHLAVGPVNAGQIDIDLKNATAALELAEKQQELANAYKKIAETDKARIEQELANVRKELEVAKARLEREVLPMQILSGQMMVVRDHSLTCNAVPFLRWKCHNTGLCDFPVDKDICGWPGKDTDTMQLTVSYKCGTEVTESIFWTGKDSKAYLSCR